MWLAPALRTDHVSGPVMDGVAVGTGVPVGAQYVVVTDTAQSELLPPPDWDMVTPIRNGAPELLVDPLPNWPDPFPPQQ